MAKRNRVIGVMGASDCGPDIGRTAFLVGKIIAKAGAVLLCGGMKGVMEYACKGAKENGGFTIGILPGRDASESPPNPYVDIPIYTGMGEARNFINICSSDAVIAISGGPGTLSEIGFAMRTGKPLVLLNSWQLKPSVGNLPENLKVAGTPEEAVELVLKGAGKNSQEDNRC